MRILAIETSCDETAIAIADFYPHTKIGVGVTRGKNGVSVCVLSHIISSQAKLHTRFGGVVPNLARREHERNLVPMLMTALRESGMMKHELRGKRDRSHNSKLLTPHSILERETELLRQFKKHIIALLVPNIDAIAVTYGPGLAPALWTGVNFARALAYLWGKPLIPINHMAGHLYSAFLQKSGEKSLQPTTYNLPPVRFPILALLVSGAHTELVLMRKHNRFQIIGETRDDAVGEAFDKVARMLGLKYPGGPEIAKFALKGNPRIYTLPRPMLHTKDYNFSFSGLKTAVFYLVRDLRGFDLRGLASWHEAKPRRNLTKIQKRDIAASFQAAAVEVLVKKTIGAAREYKVKTLAVGGGVSANAALRKHLGEAVAKEIPTSHLLLPDSSLTGDNALMIATAAYFVNQKSAPSEVRADANLRLGAS